MWHDSDIMCPLPLRRLRSGSGKRKTFRRRAQRSSGTAERTLTEWICCSLRDERSLLFPLSCSFPHLTRALEAHVHYDMDASLRRHERAFIRFILFYRIRAFQRKPEDSRGFGTILRNMKRAQSYGKQVNPLESCPRMNQRIMGPKNFLSLHKVGKLHNTSDVPKASLHGLVNILILKEVGNKWDVKNIYIFQSREIDIVEPMHCTFLMNMGFRSRSSPGAKCTREKPSFMKLRRYLKKRIGRFEVSFLSLYSAFKFESDDSLISFCIPTVPRNATPKKWQTPGEIFPSAIKMQIGVGWLSISPG